MAIKLVFFILNVAFPKILSFSSSVIEWNKLDANLQSVTNLIAFKNNLLKFIIPSPNSVFDVSKQCCNCKGIKFLKR